MRALATTRIIVFLTRRAGGADAVAARVIGQGLSAVGRRQLSALEIEPFLAELAAAGIEVVELPAARRAAVALPAPAAATAAPEAPASLPKPVESPWFSFSKILLKTQKIRGPNLR